jgi:uncharacterized membrane protein YidH (DUF202 family)
MFIKSLLLLLLLQLLAKAASAVRIKRVKAGMRYEKHDPVHVVVNKVGYVISTVVVGALHLLVIFIFGWSAQNDSLLVCLPKL